MRFEQSIDIDARQQRVWDVLCDMQRSVAGWGTTLLDLVAPGALDQRQLQPVAGPANVGNSNCACRHSACLQYTAGSGPRRSSTMA
jgi:hypothetical protein